jgi:diacylglycerol kinase
MIAMRSRLKYAYLSYALLGAAAAVTLDGNFRVIILLLLAALAFKSWLAVKRQEQGE